MMSTWQVRLRLAVQFAKKSSHLSEHSPGNVMLMHSQRFA